MSGERRNSMKLRRRKTEDSNSRRSERKKSRGNSAREEEEEEEYNYDPHLLEGIAALMELSAAPRVIAGSPSEGESGEGRPPSPRQQKPKGPLAAPFRCKICKEGFPTEKKMLIHKSVHFREVPFVCLNCFRTFDDFDVLQDHTASHRVFHCASCPSVFPDHLSLRKHLLMHPVGSIVS